MREERTVITCDLCSKHMSIKGETGITDNVSKCLLCGKDVCKECSKYTILVSIEDYKEKYIGYFHVCSDCYEPYIDTDKDSGMKLLGYKAKIKFADRFIEYCTLLKETNIKYLNELGDQQIEDLFKNE